MDEILYAPWRDEYVSGKRIDGCVSFAILQLTKILKMNLVFYIEMNIVLWL